MYKSGSKKIMRSGVRSWIYFEGRVKRIAHAVNVDMRKTNESSMTLGFVT